jgi:CDP-glycerol glycerophosphotransferase
MRINKKSPTHWYYLARSGINVFLSVPFRPLGRRAGKKRIVFYDQMNGNIEAFVRYLVQHAKDDYELYYLAFPPHHRIFPLKRTDTGVQPLSMLRLRDMVKVARADAVITAFGIETLEYYQKFTDIKFIDVWHGLPFRGYTAENFRRFKNYDETWVSSAAFKKFYQQWGWPKDKIKVTGYARVDRLVNNEYSIDELREKYDIGKKYKKVVLIAPTWEQKGGNHNPFPFGASASEFLSALNKVAMETASLIIFRLHLQSGTNTDVESLSNVRTMPSSLYPETEELLYLSDILVSDWSSIVFDYLPLHRPTIFLEVNFPFKAGFTITAEYRFGEVVDSLEALIAAIRQYTLRPALFTKKYSLAMRRTENYVWGKTLDGKAAERYQQCLEKLLK